MAKKLTAEDLNTLRWRLIHRIEPALVSHLPTLNETLQQRITRLVIERDVHAKADACIQVLRELGLISTPELVSATD